MRVRIAVAAAAGNFKKNSPVPGQLRVLVRNKARMRQYIDTGFYNSAIRSRYHGFNRCFPMRNDH
jgi:hypothetical protein